jgi:hypothetical protein
MARNPTRGGAVAEPEARRESKSPTRGDVLQRQRDAFGGFQWGADFFGWLVAVGLATLLTALLAATGAAIGLTNTNTADAADEASTIGIVGGVLLLIVLLLAYYCGGYVAGRMARFNGPRQGVGVWLIGLLVTVALAVAGVLFGAKYNVLSGLNLPRIPVDEGSLTTAGLIALAAVIVGTLLAAIAGGKAGTHFHRKIDRAGLS